MQAPACGYLSGHGCRHTDAGIRFDDGLFVALGQHRGGELVEVVNGTDAPTHGVGADAVLGVHDVVLTRGELGAQKGYRPDDAVGHRLLAAVGEVDQPDPDRRIDVAEEAAVTLAGQRPHGHLHTRRRQCLGQVQRVHHTTPGLRRIGQERDGRCHDQLRVLMPYTSTRRSAKWFNTLLALAISASTSTVTFAIPPLEPVFTSTSPPGPTTLACPKNRKAPITPV